MTDNSDNSHYSYDSEDSDDSDGATGDFLGRARTYMDVNLFSNFQLWVPKGTNGIITLPTGNLMNHTIP